MHGARRTGYPWRIYHESAPVVNWGQAIYSRGAAPAPALPILGASSSADQVAASNRLPPAGEILPDRLLPGDTICAFVFHGVYFKGQ